MKIAADISFTDEINTSMEFTISSEKYVRISELCDIVNHIFQLAPHLTTVPSHDSYSNWKEISLVLFRTFELRTRTLAHNKDLHFVMFETTFSTILTLFKVWHS